MFASELAEKMYQQSFDLAASTDEKVAITEKLIHFYTNQARFTEAYALARSLVATLGVNLHSSFKPPLFLSNWLQLECRLLRRSMRDLLEMPLATDPRIGQAVRIMNAVAKAAYQIRPELCVSLAVKIVNLCLKYGNTPDCAIGYMVFGVIFKGGVLGKYGTGYDFGRLALDLVERHQCIAQKSEVSFVVGYFGTSWKRPALESEELWRSAYSIGLETRDMFHTGCAAAATTMGMFMRGVPFKAVLERCAEFTAKLQPANLQEPLGVISSVQQAIRNLKGRTTDQRRFQRHALQ